MQIKVNCTHAHNHTGEYCRCDLGLNGGNPSFGVCSICKQRNAITNGPAILGIPGDKSWPLHVATRRQEMEKKLISQIDEILAKRRERKTLKLTCAIADYFDAIYCISLDRTPERWRKTQEIIAGSGWPFRPVIRVAAIDGENELVPSYWTQGAPAWGCLQSHLMCLVRAKVAKHDRILIMEDDVDLASDFGVKVTTFLNDVVDWDCLMLGGQHSSAPVKIHDRIYAAGKPNGIQRTHCYALQGSFIHDLFDFWSSPLDQHCDWSLGPLAAHYLTFAPLQFIAGQRAGLSTITAKEKPADWWQPPEPLHPIPYSQWPECWKLAALFAPTIRLMGFSVNGVGDVIYFASAVSGLKWIWNKLMNAGAPCLSCTLRQADLNVKYPVPPKIL